MSEPPPARKRRRTLGAGAVLLAVGFAGILTVWISSSAGPMLNDITTDTINPPTFEAVIPLRPASANAIEHGGASVIARQQERYPDIQPLQSDLTAAEAFERALETARGMGWDIVASNGTSGRIEAIATTRLLRFKDDVVVRISRTPEGSRIDIRSKSRTGRSDLGKNAARIREFFRRFED